MASFLLGDDVLYQCSCGLRKPLRRLYFCRHCVELRCGECVSHEVDTHYCPNCLENMPSAEARLKKNRCANCFDCPSCGHTLSTRASSIQVPNPEDTSRTMPKKVYYLACGFCRWTTRDVGLPDQPVASGGWQELENPSSARFQDLLEHYRTMAQKEKMDMDRKRFSRRRFYPLFSDKYGISTVVNRRRVGAGLPSIGNLILKDDDSKLIEMKPAVATDKVECLSEEFYTKPLVLSTVCSINQRLAQPEFQLAKTCNLYQQHKHLNVKQSRRCRKCEHNLIKPEYNPSSIKYKIQLSAYYHVPEVKIMAIPKFELEKEIEIILTLTNPSTNICHVFLLPLEDEQPDPFITVRLALPSSQLSLAPHDDTAEFDDFGETQNVVNNDPSIVAFQKSNKLGVRVMATPNRGAVEFKTAFLIKWDYVNTLQHGSIDSKEPQIVWLQTRIDLFIGNVEAAN